MIANRREMGSEFLLTIGAGGPSMSLILRVLGILITGAGVVTIAFGVHIQASALGQTLITAGATAVVGGPLLVGLAATVTQLGAIAEALRARRAVPIAPLADAKQPPEIQPRAGVPGAEPRLPEPRRAEPPPAAAIEVSGSLERLRSSTIRPDRVVTNGEEVPLSPNGSNHPVGEAKPEPEAQPGPAPEARREPRLDFLFRPKAPRPSSPEPLARQFPAAPSGDGSRVPAAREPRSVAILKSGVVDGMAYTLYADGSIEAQLPHGTVRFGSIAELRAHIENNS